MKVLDVQTFGVRGVPDGFHDFASPEGATTRADAHDLVLVTGPSGSGKTRFLELIVAVREALAPSDDRIDEDSWIRAGHRAAKARVSWLLSEEEQRAVGGSSAVHSTEIIFGGEDPVAGADEALVYLFERYDHTDATSKLEYFAESRRLAGGAEMSVDPVTQARFRTSKSPRKYAFLPAFLRDLKDSPATAERFAKTLPQLSRTCRYDIESASLLSRGRAVRMLQELSGSERDALLFAATASAVGLSRSILLVDRPELMGAEPLEIVAGLVALGARNQLILATARPEIAAGRKHATLHFPGEGALS